MKIKAKIKLSGSKAVLVAIPLIPDNMNNMETVLVLEEDSAETYFKATKIGSLIASVDDYLMNATIARDMIELVLNDAVREES